MRKITVLFVCFVCALSALPGAAFGGIKPNITKAGAESDSVLFAGYDWSGTGAKYTTPSCTGPYENVKGHTQWACYGIMIAGAYSGKYWQINLGPYEEQIYARLCSSKCPGSP